MHQSVSSIFGDDDVEKLVAGGYAKAAYVNYTHLLGAGILHSKLIIADNTCASVCCRAVVGVGPHTT